jgi:hypothetical protein
MDRIGSLKDWISIQQEVAVSDGQGGNTSTFTTVASEWCRATQLSYSRTLSDAGVIFNKAFKFVMRERGDTYTLDGSFRIVFNTANYTIHSIVVNKGWTEILAYV